MLVTFGSFVYYIKLKINNDYDNRLKLWFQELRAVPMSNEYNVNISGRQVHGTLVKGRSRPLDTLSTAREMEERHASEAAQGQEPCV